MAEDLKLEVIRVIKGNRALVYAAWTNFALIPRWFPPPDMEVPNAKNELKVGGEYRIVMERSGELNEPGQTRGKAVVSGVYQQIVPGELLVFTWHGVVETLVTVRFRDVDGGTEVALTHEHFATADSRDRHHYVWQGSIENLAKVWE